jgi:hypothetical protein
MEGASAQYAKGIPPSGISGGCISACVDSFDAIPIGVEINLSFSYDETGKITGANLSAVVQNVGQPIPSGSQYKANPVPYLTSPANSLSDISIDTQALRKLNSEQLQALFKTTNGSRDPISQALAAAVLNEQSRRAEELRRKKEQEQKHQRKRRGRVSAN